MGTFYTNTSPQEIKEFITSWCIEKKLMFLSKLEKQYLNNTLINIEAKSILKLFNIQWQIQGEKDRAIIKLDFKSNIIFKIINSLILLSILIFFINLLFISFPNSTFLEFMYLTILVLLTCTFWLFISKKLTNFKYSFMTFIKTKCGLSPGTMIMGGFYIFDLPSFWTFLLSLFLMALLFFIKNGAEPVFFLYLLTFFSPVIPISFYYITKNYYAKWKILMMAIIEKWITTLSFLIIFVFGLAWLNSGITILSTTESKEKDDISLFKSIFSATFSSDVVTRVLKPKDRNLNLLNSFASIKIEKNIQNYKSSHPNYSIKKNAENIIKEIQRKYVKEASFYILSFILIMLLSHIYCLRRVLNSATDWGETIGKYKKPYPIVHSFTHLRLIPKSANFIILAMYGFMSVVTIIGTIFSIDILNYAIFDDTLIFKNFSVLFAWVFTSLNVLLNEIIGLICGKIILLLFGLPGLYYISKTMERIIRYIILIYIHKIKKDYRNYTKKVVEFQNFLKNISAKLHMPELIVTKNIPRPLFIRGRLFSKKSTLFVHPLVITYFSKKELKAAIAHEFGHLSYGLRKIEWLRFLSILSMYPNYYLTLYIDPILYEIEADTFAINNGISTKDLTKSIIKLSILDFSNKPSHWQRMGDKIYKAIERIFKVKGVKMVNEFFFGDSILGYSHLVLSQRILHLQGIKE